MVVLSLCCQEGIYIFFDEGSLLPFSYAVSTLVFLCALYLNLPLTGAAHRVWVGSSSGKLSGAVVKGMQTTLRLILDFAIDSALLGKMHNFPDTQLYKLLTSVCSSPWSTLRIARWEAA